MLEKVRPLLKGAEDRKSFFGRIASFLPPTDPRYRSIEKAYDSAKDAFRDIERDNGGRYFEHLRAVALILIDYLRVKNHTLIMAALLHDIVEDIPSWTVERVRAEFGDEVALLVDYLSKPTKKEFSSDKERLAVYRNRFQNAPREFFLIKLADRLHNLLTMWDLPSKKVAFKIEETKRYYLPFAEKHLILLYELEEAIEDLQKPKTTKERPLGEQS
ncbi:MAG: HD domain-containing protein [Candidatus Nealsonbacteria bacterium]|nr:HD domain-containing protein [Candidatus Nealsonbacteria bacterium]